MDKALDTAKELFEESNRVLTSQIAEHLAVRIKEKLDRINDPENVQIVESSKKVFEWRIK